MSRRWFILLAPLLSLLPGCAGVPYERGEALADAVLARRLRGQFDGQPASGFRALHRAILKTHGREFTFSLYVLGRPTGDLRCMGIDDFGGKLFDVLRRPGTEAQVIRSERGVPASWLRDGLIRDLAIVYGRPSDTAGLVQHGQGSVGLTEELADGDTQEYLFDGHTGRLTDVVRLRGRHRCVHRMSFATAPAGRPADGIGAPWSSAHVSNYQGHYELDLELREIKVMAVPDRVFAPDDSR